MENLEQTARVADLCAYLAGIGRPVTVAQGLEVLARALGPNAQHASARAGLCDSGSAKVAQTGAVLQTAEESQALRKPLYLTLRDGSVVPLLTRGESPFNADELAKYGWSVDTILLIPLDCLSVVSKRNAYVSKLLTGDEVALKNIKCVQVPDIINEGEEGCAYFRVTGTTCTPTESAESEGLRGFYRGVLALSSCLVENVALRTKRSIWAPDYGNRHVSKVHAEAFEILQDYAREEGANYDAVIAHAKDPVFELADGSPENPGPGPVRLLLLGDFLRAIKLSEGGLKPALMHGDEEWYIGQDSGCLVMRFAR